MPQIGTGAIAIEQVGVPTAHIISPLEQNGAASGPLPLLLDDEDDELLTGAPLELELDELLEELLEELIQPASPGKNPTVVLQPGVFTPDITTHPGAPTLPFIQAAVPMLHTTNIPEQVIELPLLLEEEDEELLAGVPLELELEETEGIQLASPG